MGWVVWEFGVWLVSRGEGSDVWGIELWYCISMGWIVLGKGVVLQSLSVVVVVVVVVS